METDWERIVRLHQGNREEQRAHSLGILIFAMLMLLTALSLAVAAIPDALAEDTAVDALLHALVPHKFLGENQ